MGSQPPLSSAVRFGLFEVDFTGSELRKNGIKLKLQEQPFRVLAMLVERPGEVVTREELQHALWPEETFVDFENSLNTAVAKLREALGDSASHPRFIATVPRRGYRFVGQIEEAPSTPAESVTQRRRNLPAVVLAMFLALSLAAVLVLLYLWPRSELPVRKFSFSPGADVADPIISPNGRHIAYVSQNRLWIQDLDKEQPREIEGTEGAGSPFWSLDSAFVAFVGQQRSRVPNEMKKVPVGGGQPIHICRASNLIEAAAWNPDGDIITFSSLLAGRFVLYQVSAKGGIPSLLEATAGRDYPNLTYLPDKPRIVVCTKRSGGGIALYDLDSGEERILGDGLKPVFSPSGHLLYQAAGIWALPFSSESLEATGEPFRIAASGTNPSVARDGTLVYLDRRGAVAERLVWRDREGTVVGVIGRPQREISQFALSPDESRVAVQATEEENSDIWIHYIGRNVRDRVTIDPTVEALPVWSPSGEQIAFSSNRNENWDIYVTPADGTGERRRVIATDRPDYVSDWSLDGKYLLFCMGKVSPETSLDIWYGQRTEGEDGWKLSAFFETESNEFFPRFSPDARYVAYNSRESGNKDVYVREFPSGAGRVPVSANGGAWAMWRRDGKELFYVEGKTLVAVPVTTTPAFSVTGPPQKLFELKGDSIRFDVSADGQRFVVIEPVESDSPPAIRVVQNWYAEFRERQ